jgi:hypothetical protein
VETGDYTLELPELGWRLEGERETGEIRIIIAANAGQRPALQRYGWRHRLMEWRSQRASRPNNRNAAYNAEVYSALAPYPLRR